LLQDIIYGQIRRQAGGTLFSGKHERGALWLLICGALEKHLLTYLRNLDTVPQYKVAKLHSLSQTNVLLRDA